MNEHQHAPCGARVTLADLPYVCTHHAGHPEGEHRWSPVSSEELQRFLDVAAIAHPLQLVVNPPVSAEAMKKLGVAVENLKRACVGPGWSQPAVFPVTETEVDGMVPRHLYEELKRKHELLREHLEAEKKLSAFEHERWKDSAARYYDERCLRQNAQADLAALDAYYGESIRSLRRQLEAGCDFTSACNDELEAVRESIQSLQEERDILAAAIDKAVSIVHPPGHVELELVPGEEPEAGVEFAVEVLPGIDLEYSWVA